MRTDSFFLEPASSTMRAKAVFSGAEFDEQVIGL